MDSSPCSEGWVRCYVIATYRFWLSHPNRGFQREVEAILLFSPPLHDIGRRTPRPRVVSMAISNVQRLMCSFTGRTQICLGLEDHSAWHTRSSSARNFFLVQCGYPRWCPLIYLNVSRVFTHALRLPRSRHHTALFSDSPTVKSVGLTVQIAC